MTLTDFLLERIAEDEDAARAAAEACINAPSRELSDRWQAEVETSAKGNSFGAVYGAPIQATRPTAFAAAAPHIARHDPARVLAECTAKRRIVEECIAKIESGDGGDGVIYTSGGDLGQSVLSLLALPYADHPDYLEVWRP